MIIITEQNKKDFSKEIRSARKEVLYLGQWCKSLDDKDFLSGKILLIIIGVIIIKEKRLEVYRKFVSKDFNLFNKILNDFSWHDLERSEAEIFYGLWLKTYLIVAFDRWEIIDNLPKKYKF